MWRINAIKDRYTHCDRDTLITNTNGIAVDLAVATAKRQWQKTILCNVETNRNKQVDPIQQWNKQAIQAESEQATKQHLTSIKYV